MAAIQRHSTRIMGFHLRELQTARGDETEMYSAQIFHGDMEAGTARNDGNGGSDLVRIDPAHREVWERLVRYMEEHPRAVREDGCREEYHSGEEAAMALLRDIHDADARLFRSRKFRSALLGYRWNKPFPSGGWWVEGCILFSPDSGIPLDTVPGDLFHMVVIGQDNLHFVRETAPAVPGSEAPRTADPLRPAHTGARDGHRPGGCESLRRDRARRAVDAPVDPGVGRSPFRSPRPR